MISGKLVLILSGVIILNTIFALHISVLERCVTCAPQNFRRLLPRARPSMSVHVIMPTSGTNFTETIAFSEVSDRLLHAKSDDERISTYSIVSQNLSEIKSIGRVGLNMVLNSYFKLKRYDEALKVVSTIKSLGSRFEADTINILLFNSFKIDGSGALAEQFYMEHYVTPSLVPSARTLNIMMEGFRTVKSTSKVLYYFSLFSEFGIKPDAYTFSTRVRVSTSSQECLEILEIAKHEGSLRGPLTRCAMETIGELGSPETAYAVALKYLDSGQRINEFTSSGDALLAALLSTTDTNATIEKSSTTFSPTAVAMELIINSRIKYGPKGFCIVLSYFQRIRHGDGCYEFDSQTVAKFRDVLWERAKLSGFVNESNINGRVCDALLRSHIHQVDKARSLWKYELLPLAEIVRKERGVSDFNEIVEKSFEALMFICGQAHRPDIALEIAITIRKRNWSRISRKKLAWSYSRGKKTFDGITRGYGGGMRTMLYSGLEKSVESELGVLFSDDKKRCRVYGLQNRITRIRIKY